MIAPPLLTETIRTHYALKEIAAGLARAGFDVLRFDYSGCGDSRNRLEDLSAADWEADLENAVDELKDLTGRSRVSIFCARFSAAVVAQASGKQAFETVVTWDPLMEGAEWIKQMKHVRGLLPNAPLAGEHEFLGEITGAEFERSILELRPDDIAANRVVALVTDSQSQGRAHWETRRIDFDSSWRRPFTENLFSHQVIDEAIAVLSE